MCMYLSIYMRMYVYDCMCMCIVYVYCVFVLCICIVYVSICMCMYLYVSVCICTYVYVSVSVHICMYLYVCASLYIVEFSSSALIVDEPANGLQLVNIRVNRLGGTMSIVAVQWTAALTSAGCALVIHMLLCSILLHIGTRAAF